MPNMYTTQLYLPPELHNQIDFYAKSSNQPKAKVIRELISSGLKLKQQETSKSISGQALLEVAKEAKLLLKDEELPEDLSENHDKYTWE